VNILNQVQQIRDHQGESVFPHVKLANLIGGSHQAAVLQQPLPLRICHFVQSVAHIIPELTPQVLQQVTRQHVPKHIAGADVVVLSTLERAIRVRR